MGATGENILTTPLRALRNLLYPPKCALCGCLVRERDGLLCSDCRQTLTQVQAAEPKQIRAGLLCSAPFYYQEPLRAAFLRYKFQGKDFYGSMFGAYVAQAAREQLTGPFDLVTWAPLSKQRLRERDYDQARLLAVPVARAFGLPLVRTLKKVRNTKPQSSLNGRERQENARNVYALYPGAQVQGKRILLVDDILTTGSTLSACADVLLEQGAAEVSCAVLARHADEEP
ncbi:MAG: ComF family protein [Oscillospiraceae bacterium]|nr:ComF family protein [Oscillospiraceae bacterium]